FEIYTLIKILNLIKSRVDRTICRHQLIGTEDLVVLQIITTKITSIDIELNTIFIHDLYTLITPIAYISIYHMITRINYTSILFKLTITISHSMAVFTHDIRSGFITRLSIGFHMAYTRIHGGHDIRVFVLPGLFKHHQPRRIILF